MNYSFVELINFIRVMNVFSFQLLYKVSFSCSKWYPFSFPSFVSGRLDPVLCLSVISTVIGSNIFSVHRSSIKLLWCCLYVVLSWETETDFIVFEHQRRQRICFKKIVTSHETRHPQYLIFFLCNFSFFLSFCFHVFMNKVLYKRLGM